jgi:hypothetical protein
MLTPRIRKALAICAISLGLVALAIAAFLAFAVWSTSAGSSLSRVYLSDSELPVTLTVFGRSSGGDAGSSSTISARLAFFSPDGDLSGSLERSWSGWELKVDCVTIGTTGGWLVFPCLVTTDETAGSGVDLFRYYNRSGFPAIYDSPRLTQKERSALRRLFWLVRVERWLPRFPGTLGHQTVVIRTFEAGTGYSLLVSRDGKLGLRNDYTGPGN